MNGLLGWMCIWPLLIVAGLVVIGYAVLHLVRDGRRTSLAPNGFGGTDPRRIVDERYARGEIGEDEYRLRRDRLS
jgi:putative membrane protein